MGIFRTDRGGQEGFFQAVGNPNLVVGLGLTRRDL